MKIAILTQSLKSNYGGLLQAFALQHHLKSDGHNVFTVDFIKINKPRFFGIKGIVKNILSKCLFKKRTNEVRTVSDSEERVMRQHTNRFIAEYIKLTQRICSLQEFDQIENYNFDAFIVGSDQVWRPSYSPGISAFFLEFLEKNSSMKSINKARRIAYAASFGLDNCDEFDHDDSVRFSKLLKKFDAIGVREDSAKDLCRKYFGVAADHVLDPTLLLDKEVYIKITEDDNANISDGNLMVYLLDNNNEKKLMVQRVSKVLGLNPFEVTKNKNGVYPSVSQWLRGFIDAQYVVTDSFHGVAFSIIFNKPFIAIGNIERGLARFKSILTMFDLEERLILNPNQLTESVINSRIDFDKVNKLRNEERTRAIEFLQIALNGK